MIVCALKLTHDSTVALIEGDRLLASVELEKLENRALRSSTATAARASRRCRRRSLRPWQ